MAFFTITKSKWSALTRRGELQAFLLLLVLFSAFALRLPGIGWDGGHFFHPDERSIYMRAACMYDVLTEAPGWELCGDPAFPKDSPGIPSIGTFFDKDASPLNPHWFPIGTIMIYLLVGVRAFLGLFMDHVSLQDLAVAGRMMAVLADVGMVLMLYTLGSRMYGRAAGLLAAAFGAFAAMYIQMAVYYRPEPFVALLALGAFWWMLNVLERGRARDHLGLGVVIGLSFAFRASSLPLLLPVALTYGVLAWRSWQRQRGGGTEAVAEGYSGEDSGEKVEASGAEQRVPVARAAAPWVVLKHALAAGLAAFATFAVLQPYALLDYRQFVGDLAWEAAKTAGSVPYTVQYIGIPLNGLFEVRQSAVWGLGLPLGLVAWGGLALTLARAFRRPVLHDYLVLALVVPSLFLIVAYEIKFLRYLVVVLPFMMLLGSRWLVAALERARLHSPVLARTAMGVSAFVVIATAFFALAFATGYARAHPAVQASDWLNAKAEAGTSILTDNHWDEGIPHLGPFNVRQLPMYEGDTLTKVQNVSEWVAGADYIVAYSNRPWGSIPLWPERYPYSTAFYHALFSGELGYELAQAFHRYPSLLGVTFVHDPFTRPGLPKPAELPGVRTGPLTFNLGYADENVTNYDRPLVLVWRNTGRLSAEDIGRLMLEGGDAPPAERAMLSVEERDAQREGGTWTELFHEDGLNRVAPWLVWLLVVELVFLATLPLSVRLFRWLPDRGVVLARPLGLLLVAWLVWLGASIGVWTFSRASIGLAIAAVALASATVLYRHRRLMLEMARRRWRYLVSVEVLFVAAFLVFVLIRAANPDLWHPWRGGEKPMDLAYLTAVVKSTTFPPYDPWYAGGHINYYYFGFVIVGVLIKLTGIVPSVAYNLAVPLLFALTLTGVFSVGFNLAESFRRRRPHLPLASSLGAGGASALLVVVLANVDGLVQVLQGGARVVTGGDFGAFDFWRSSRLMPGEISITEFPFWTFLFADLHAHLISLPFQVLILGLLANLALSAPSPLSMLRRAPALAATAWVAGSLAAINTWDVPAYGLLSLAVLGVLLFVRLGDQPLRAARWWLLWAAVFWGLLYALWLPFHQHYDTPFDGLRVSQWQTVLWHYLGIHALLLFIAGSWLVREFYLHFLRPPRLSPGPGAWPASDTEVSLEAVSPAKNRRRFITASALVVGLLVWFMLPALRQWTTAAVLGVFLFMAGMLAISWLMKRDRQEMPAQVLLLAMVGAALGIGIAVDIVTLRNDIDRMNTVFKLYLNAWVLFGTVGGVALWRLWASSTNAFSPMGNDSASPQPSEGRRPHLSLRNLWLGVLAVLVLASAVFPALGTRGRLADRFDTTLPLTLNGTVYQAAAVYNDPGGGAYPLHHDAEALEFLRQNVQGSPVVLEAVTPQYRWTPRVAKYTGLPVVVGYEWHQIQQRGAEGGDANVRRRVQDVEAAYREVDDEPFWRVVERYGVEYIYVGPVERLYYPQEGVAKFDRLTGHGLELAFANEEVRIYRVARAP